MSIDPITAVLDLGGTLIKRLFPDPNEQAKQTLKLQELASEGRLAELQKVVTLMQGQLTVNLEEAKHPSIFIAGWRPFVGWVCGFSVLYVGIFEPFIRMIALFFGYTGDFPVIDTDITLQILGAILGIGALRTADKIKDKDTKTINNTKR